MDDTQILPKAAIALHFRDELRVARLVALANAENFGEILFVIERFGVQLTNTVDGLQAYSEKIAQIADQSPLAMEHDDDPLDWQINFSTLVRNRERCT